ncbi:MAG TPA: tRNA pseudouridine(13) synthase TruD [Steroidobacteraceae bacterium]|nr:tRNA pseudouridine(13) synthase TruD [Steroidobacteraceae bacterium]
MTLETWRQLALDPPRAWGDPRASGVLRAVPEDFVVEEDLGFAPDGDGAHLLLKVRKRNANTGWVAQELARALGCPVRDVGFAGLKDRRAIAIQWFSLPATPRSLAGAAALQHPEFVVLETHRHRRKLPRGALAGNAFTVRIRAYSGTDAALQERCHRIATIGVPNYFGPQRFGREGANLARLLASASAASAARPGRPDGFVLSAARSLIFNAVLGERVRQGSWGTLAAGDVANLDGRGSVFPVAELTPDLPERLAQLQIHPTGPMWGAGELMSRGPPLQLEQRVAEGLTVACEFTIAAGLRQERRSLRLTVRDLQWQREADGIVLRFWLRSGSFATAVVRELLGDGSAPNASRIVDADDV